MTEPRQGRIKPLSSYLALYQVNQTRKKNQKCDLIDEVEQSKWNSYKFKNRLQVLHTFPFASDLSRILTLKRCCFNS